MKTLAELEREGNKHVKCWNSAYRPVNAKCRACGGRLWINTMVVLTSIPAQYEYICYDCGNAETSYLKLEAVE